MNTLYYGDKLEKKKQIKKEEKMTRDEINNIEGAIVYGIFELLDIVIRMQKGEEITQHAAQERIEKVVHNSFSRIQDDTRKKFLQRG